VSATQDFTTFQDCVSLVQWELFTALEAKPVYLVVESIKFTMELTASVHRDTTTYLEAAKPVLLALLITPLP